MNNQGDRKLLDRIRKDDLKAFEQLFHQYYPGLCRYAESLVHKPEIAEEVVQDLFYSIWKNREVMELHTGWHSYLFRAVYNNAMMTLRRSKRELPLDEDWAGQQPDTARPLEEEMEAGEMGTVIQHTLMKLPGRAREIFQMSRVDGLKYREIAERLSISVKTVEANMGRTLKALRFSLEAFRNNT